MAESKKVREWMETHSGDPCSFCGTTYLACTRGVFRASGKACCIECSNTETHNEVVTKPRLERTMRTLPEPGRVPLSLITSIHEAVEELTNVATSVAELKSMVFTIEEEPILATVTLTVDGYGHVDFTIT